MRILYFLAHPSGIGGASKVLMTQARIMHDNGNEVLVVIQDDEKGRHNSNFDDLLKEFKLDYASLKYPIATCFEEIDILASQKAMNDIQDIVLKFKPDIIHSVQINIAVEIIARKHGIHHLMNAYPICPGMFNIKWEDLYANYHSADSEFYCKRWHDGLGIESRCIRVSYEKPQITIKQRENEILKLICIATFDEHKNQLRVLELVNKCKQNGMNVYVTFLGNNQSEYGEKCKQYVLDNDLNQQVNFAGFVINVNEYLQEADLLVHMSLAESYPGVIVEAMANKVPVMTLPVAGITELVKDSFNGFLIEENSVEAALVSLNKFMTKRENGYLETIIDNAYETYLENHTFRSTYVKLLQYYQDILNHNKTNNYIETEEKLKKINFFIHQVHKQNVTKFTQNKMWFLYHINGLHFNKNCKVLIWGAGDFGKYALEWCKLLELTPKYYIDTYKNGTYLGIDIRKPDTMILQDADVIFVAINNLTIENMIMEELDNIGKQRNINYFLLTNDPCI